MPAPRLIPALIMVFLAAIGTQISGFSGPLVWDDAPLLAESDLYTNPDRLAEALAHPLGRETFYWRPLVTTSFLAGSLIHGVDATGFRVTGALLHALVALLVWVLLARVYCH